LPPGFRARGHDRVLRPEHGPKLVVDLRHVPLRWGLPGLTRGVSSLQSNSQIFLRT
jgi:hypothetical protein